MATKHTPGPWIITAQPGYSEWWIEAPGVDVAEVRSGEADALLIAAAPDLLAEIARLREAFYVKGTSKALREAFASTPAHLVSMIRAASRAS